MKPRQLDLYGETWEQRAHAWIHTPQGGEVMSKFIRYALQMKARGFKTYGSKAICEWIRYQYDLKHGPEGSGERFKINNNYATYMGVFAMKRQPKLQGFFKQRDATTPRRAVVVPIKERRAG